MTPHVAPPMSVPKRIPFFFDIPGGSSYEMKITRDGSLLVMGHWDLWNLSTHKRLSSGKIRGAHALALSPDNRFLAAGGNYSEFRIWDLRTKKIYWDLTLAAHGNTVIDQLDFTPDGRYLVSLSTNNMLRVWEVGTKKPISIYCFPSSTPLRNEWQEYVRAWRTLAGDTPPDNVKSFVIFKDTIDSCRFAIHPDGKSLAVTTGSEKVLILDLLTGKVLKTLLTTQSATYQVCFSPDGKWLAIGAGGGHPRRFWGSAIELWNAETGKHVHTLKGHHHFVSHLAFSPDSAILASGGGIDGVRVWDVATGNLRYALYQRELKTEDDLYSEDSRVSGIAFLPGGQTLVTLLAKPVPVHFWDALTGKPVTLLPRPRPLP